MKNMFRTAAVILTVLLMISCESESAIENDTSANMTMVTANQSRAEIQTAYMEWREGITEGDRDDKREYLMERGFLLEFVICDEDEEGIKGETWTFDTNCDTCARKPLIKTNSNDDYEKWVLDANCDEH